MRFAFLLFISIGLITTSLKSQKIDGMTDLPYSEIGEQYPSYAPGSVVARMIDGLGYRYYWASDSLTHTDLNYRPTDEARSTSETISHIYDLSVMILNGVNNAPNVRPSTSPDYSYEEFRAHTLKNLKSASSTIAGQSTEQMDSLHVIFENHGEIRKFPFWNAINGPISDAMYHCGQIVSFRRITGNPINSKVSVFMGKNRS